MRVSFFLPCELGFFVSKIIDMTIAELKNLAQQIKLANLTAENSAVRVGSLFEYLVNYIAQLEIAESPNGGASAYEIYVATTTDNPVLSEIEWIHSLYGEDGVTPTIGTNGNWFIGDTDTGVKAQPENPVPVMQYYNGHKNCAEAYTGSIEDIDPDYHLCDGTDVPGYGKVPDMRGMFIVGFDPRTSPVPTTEPGLIKNYGAIGNKGGVDFYKLSGAQSGLQEHDHPITDIESDNSGSSKNAIKIENTDHLNTATIKTAKVAAKDATENHENRPTYFVIAWIIRVKPLVISGVGNGIESIVAGANVTIDVTDPKNPTINVPVVNGEDGRGIVSHVKTGTVGLLDTYTITYTDGTTDTYTVTNGTPGTTLTADQLQIINTVPLICSDEEKDLTSSTDVPKIHFTFQTAQSFTKIVGELNTAAAGGTFTVVAKKNEVSFLSTNLTFDSGENTTRTAAVPFVFTTPTVSFSVGDYVEIFVTSIGSVVPGKGLKIYLM